MCVTHNREFCEKIKATHVGMVRGDGSLSVEARPIRCVRVCVCVCVCVCVRVRACVRACVVMPKRRGVPCRASDWDEISKLEKGAQNAGAPTGIRRTTPTQNKHNTHNTTRARTDTRTHT